MDGLKCPDPDCSGTIPAGATECPKCGRDLKTLEKILEKRVKQEGKQKVIRFRKERKKRESAVKEKTGKTGFALSVKYIELFNEYCTTNKRKKKHALEEALYDFFKKYGIQAPPPTTPKKRPA